jgi:hypothetical protein
MGRNLVIACMALAAAAATAAATATATPGDRGQDFVQTQAIAARCQKSLPGLKLQLQEGRQHWLSTLDAAQLQAAEVYASSKEGKALEKCGAGCLPRLRSQYLVRRSDLRWPARRVRPGPSAACRHGNAGRPGAALHAALCTDGAGSAAVRAWTAST